MRVIAVTLIACALSTGQTLAQDSFDANALKHLASRAKASESDAVIVYRNGVKIFDYYAGKPEPIFLMSCTKSITALAVGEAIAEGKIKSIDEPVYDFYPEWKQGKKRLITIRQLLTMTSGLQNTGRGDEVYDAPDSVKLALAAELYTPPGAAFTYNNKSVNLLSGIIHVATGQPLDDYVRDHFFTPMGIKSWQWTRDDAGNPYAMADLVLYPEDFAKFGTLVLQKGQWNGKQLVPTVWIEQIGLQSQPYEPDYGLLWWRAPTSAIGVVTPKRVAEIAAGGASPAFVKQLATLENKPMHSMTEWHQRLAAVTPDWEKATYLPEVIGSHATDIPTWTYAGFDGVAAEGYLGQYLVVFPKLGLVGVRMIKPLDGYDYNRNRFEDFADAVRALARTQVAEGQ